MLKIPDVEYSHGRTDDAHNSGRHHFSSSLPPVLSVVSENEVEHLACPAYMYSYIYNMYMYILLSAILVRPSKL